MGTECAKPSKLSAEESEAGSLRKSDTAGRLKPAAGFSPQSGSPGGGLTATYRTPYEEPCAYELSAAEGVLLNSLFSHGF